MLEKYGQLGVVVPTRRVSSFSPIVDTLQPTFGPVISEYGSAWGLANAYLIRILARLDRQMTSRVDFSSTLTILGQSAVDSHHVVRGTCRRLFPDCSSSPSLRLPPAPMNTTTYVCEMRFLCSFSRISC